MNKIFKVLLSFLPAMIFTWNYNLLSAGSYPLVFFILFSAIITWSFWNLNSSDRVLEKTFRYTEIACFIIPISTFLCSLLLASVLSQSGDKLSSGIGIAASLIGGIVASFIALLFSALFGVVFHIVANNFQKKAEQESSDSFSSKFGLVVVLGIAFICNFIGFFLGFHKLNTLKQVVDKKDFSTSSIINKSFSDAPKDETKKDLPSQPLILKGATIRYVEMDYSFQNHFKLTTKIQNKSGKKIKGFQGSIVVKDIFDNVLGSYEVSEVNSLSNNETKSFYGTYDYNQFDSDDAKIVKSKGQLHYALTLEKIIYSDGSKQSF
jgi:hypothetical protein